MLIQSYILVQVDLSDKSVSISGGGLVNNIYIGTISLTLG
jgi:hypothetical protein